MTRTCGSVNVESVQALFANIGSSCRTTSARRRTLAALASQISLSRVFRPWAADPTGNGRSVADNLLGQPVHLSGSEVRGKSMDEGFPHRVAVMTLIYEIVWQLESMFSR